MDYRKESLKLHEEWRGKIEVTPRVPVDTREHLSLAYTPGRQNREAVSPISAHSAPVLLNMI